MCYQQPPGPSAFSVCVSESDVGVCATCESYQVHQYPSGAMPISELVKTECLCLTADDVLSKHLGWGVFGVSSW